MKMKNVKLMAMSFNIEEQKHEGKTFEWHKYFLELSRLVAKKSKDKSTKCGCVLVKNKRIIGTGYNGWTSGTEDYENDLKHKRPTKYLYFEHSERNALYSCAKHGVATDGATAYITGPPCIDCTRALIQSGITAILIPKQHNMLGKHVSKHWKEQFVVCEELIKNANIEFFCLEIDNELL